MAKTRLAVVGCGGFGQHHLRVAAESPRVDLVAAVDIDAALAQRAAERYGCATLTSWRELAGGKVDAAIVVTPTETHGEVGVGLLEAGVDVLMEKPIAATKPEADRMCAAARAGSRVLQVGHLERFNPAVLALRKVLTLPLFFEVHRMAAFAPRSLDVDVVLDLMIHDLDLVLSIAKQMPAAVHAAGIRVLSNKVDIANVRLEFPDGCIANLTASRVSTEKVRKLRLFQPHQYISIDFSRQDGVAITVNEQQQIGFQQLSGEKREPLAAQLDTFLDAVESRSAPVVTGEDATRALEVCLDILGKIEVHGAVVQQTLERYERGS